LNLNSGEALNVTGCVNFTGSTLNITLTKQEIQHAEQSGVYNAVYYGCSAGMFSNITVNSNDRCSTINLKNEYYNDKSLALVMAVSNHCGDDGLKTWIVIVVAVACAVAVVVIILVVSKLIAKRRADQIQRLATASSRHLSQQLEDEG